MTILVVSTRGPMKAARRLSNRQAQTTLRERRLAAGLTQISLWIPIERKASFLDTARRVREDPDLEADARKAMS